MSKYIRRDQIPELSLEIYRQQALNVAEDFAYPDETIEAVASAKTESEISRIMADARINGLQGKRRKHRYDC